MTCSPVGSSLVPALLLTTLLVGSPAERTHAGMDSMDPASGDFAQRAALLLELATEARDETAAARAHYQLGRHFNSVGLFSQAEAQARMAAGLVDRDGDPELAIDIDLMQAALLMRLDRGFEATEILLDALDAIDRLGLIDAGVRARITLSTLQSQAGAPEAARATALAALKTAEAHNMTDWQARLLINLMRIELTMPAKRDRMGEPWMSQVMDLDADEFTDETQISLLLAQLFYARTSGELDNAVYLGERVSRQAEVRGNVFLSGIADRETAQLHCGQGELEWARARFESSVAKFEQADNVGEKGFTLNRWADCEAAAGNFERAFELDRRGNEFIAERRQRQQEERVLSASLAFNTEQNLRELERLTAQETILGASLARERWRAGALLALSGMLLALLAMAWLRQRRLHERQQAEHRLAQAQIELLARVSHEIRNPAQSLAGVLDSLRLQSPKVTDDPHFKAALGSSRLITHLAQDYLDLAMSEQGRLSVDARDVCETRSILENVKHIGLAMVPQEQHSIHLDVADDVPEKILTDGDRLTQVLLNGVVNALKHGGSGPVTLRACMDEARAELRFEIEDKGPGFSCQDHRLFEPYWKAADSDPRGSGLGLAVSAAIIKRLGGSIQARNLEPHGALLSIRLPIQPLPAMADKTEWLGPVQVNRRFPHIRVAIVDDDSHSSLGLSAMAEALGCRVETGEDGASLEICMERFDPQLVILDQQLAQSTGGDLARQIRTLDAEAGRGHRRVLIVSGSQPPEQANEPAYDEWLQKPLSLRALIAQLELIDPASG